MAPTTLTLVSDLIVHKQSSSELGLVPRERLFVLLYVSSVLWFANSKPKWVIGDFEPGYEDYDRYGSRGSAIQQNDPISPPKHPISLVVR